MTVVIIKFEIKRLFLSGNVNGFAEFGRPAENIGLEDRPWFYTGVAWPNDLIKVYAISHARNMHIAMISIDAKRKKFISMNTHVLRDCIDLIFAFIRVLPVTVHFSTRDHFRFRRSWNLSRTFSRRNGYDYISVKWRKLCARIYVVGTCYLGDRELAICIANRINADNLID